MGHYREPIKHTCPDIDKYIRRIKNVLTTERNLRTYEHDELLASAIDMSSELESCIDYLEELRSSNDTLRQWGIEEAEKVDELELQIEELSEKQVF